MCNRKDGLQWAGWAPGASMGARDAGNARWAQPGHRRVWLLWLGVLIAVLLAAVLPATALPDGYHAFADQRTRWGVPHALNVWSNLPFALMGAWLLLQAVRWNRHSRRCMGAFSRGAHRGCESGAQRCIFALLLLTALGLLLTAVCSSVYHLEPHDAGLCVDRLGMSMAFAGVLGLAVADRLAVHAGAALALLLLVVAPATAWWAWQAGNMTPWAALQGAGLMLLLWMGMTQWPARLGVAWWAVVLAYAAAKGLEVADHALWTATGELISGHALKHVVAALAVQPILLALRRLSTPVTHGAAAARPGCTAGAESAGEGKWQGSREPQA